MEGETLARRCPADGTDRRFAHGLLSYCCCCSILLSQVKHPCILQHFDSFLERVNGKRVAVFLDYDGMVVAAERGGGGLCAPGCCCCSRHP